MLQIKRITTGDIQENCYLVYNENNLLIIDPGAQAQQIIDTITHMKKQPIAILLTHTHYDHIGAVEDLRHKYEIPVYVSPLEQEWLTNPILNLSGLSRHNDIPDVIVQPAEHTFKLKDYTIGGIHFSVVPTHGHSIGSLSFIFDDFVITGDALFKGSIGRTDLHTGSLDQLLNSIQTYLFTLPNELPAYPGHGDPTTIEHEKKNNPFFN